MGLLTGHKRDPANRCPNVKHASIIVGDGKGTSASLAVALEALPEEPSTANHVSSAEASCLAASELGGQAGAMLPCAQVEGRSRTFELGTSRPQDFCVSLVNPFLFPLLTRGIN